MGDFFRVIVLAVGGIITATLLLAGAIVVLIPVAFVGCIIYGVGSAIFGG